MGSFLCTLDGDLDLCKLSIACIGRFANRCKMVPRKAGLLESMMMQEMYIQISVEIFCPHANIYGHSTCSFRACFLKPSAVSKHFVCWR